jgi:glycerol-3-phosphate acyltransferase PlsX
MTTIALDAVGGDVYPLPQINGALAALDASPELSIILVGPKELLEQHLPQRVYDKNRLSIFDASEIIDMEESAASALKNKPNSSIVVGTTLHKKGIANAFVSAGNTGALLAASIFILGKLEGIIRPTIAAQFPTIHGFRLLVDAGANLSIKRPEIYRQFGLMASIYCQYVLDIDNPRIGLLNVGEEKEKGTDELKEAYHLLSELPNFVGNIEGRDILPCKADIFLTDGLVGNILLKFGESLPEALKILVQKEMKEKGFTKEQSILVLDTLKNALNLFIPDDVGGVPFLGVNGTILVGHGDTSETAIKNLVLGAKKCVNKAINEKMLVKIQ